MSLDRLQATSTETKLLPPSGGRVALSGNSVLGLPCTNLPAATITTAGAGTYTAANIKSGLIARDPTGASRTDTTDTAANILAALTQLTTDGDTFTCYLINTADAAETITLAGGSGVTIVNVGQTLAQNESAVLLFRRTSSTTIDMYIVGA